MKRTLAVVLLVAGCGDDGATVVDGAVGDTRVADTPIDNAPGIKEGQVFISEVATTPTPTSLAYASLLDGPLEVTLADADGCVTMPNNPATSLPAGTITITGTTAAVTLVQAGQGEVYSPNAPAPTDLFTAGATLTVSGTGATVPAFTGTVTAPAKLENVAFPSTLSRSAPATITWTAGTGTAMWFLLTTSGGAMLCRGPDNGSFTLTTAALALLSSTATSARIIGYRVSETTATAGAWKIYLRAADGLTSTQITLGS